MNYPIVRPIVIDLETYYKEGACSVRAHKKSGWVGGNWHYTHHREFYAYMVSWVDIETGACGIIDDPTIFENFLAELRGRTVIAHNAGFDMAVARKYYPEFAPLNTFDTADMSAYLQSGRSLAEAARNLLGVSIDKGMRAFMNGKHYQDLSPAEQKSMKDYALSDSLNTAELFRRYKDCWPDLEKWMSNYTRLQNEQGIHIDVNYLEEQIDKVSAIRSKAVAKIPWVEDMDVDKPLSAPKLARFCRESGIPAPESLAEDSEECQAWERAYGEAYPVVGAIRDFRKSNTYYKKLLLIRDLLRPDGTIPLATKYAAAPHTLRFSATQFNYQSLPRASEYCDLRGCLVPPPGDVFVGSDLAGIEARCLPWLAGDYDYLNQVAALDTQAADAGITGGGDIYEPAARSMFKYADPRPLRKADKDLRNATKACVLQLGYQAGSSKFLWYIENNLSASDLNRVRQGTESNAELAHRLVKLYRGMNPKVQDLWYSVDRDLRTSQIAGIPFTVQQPNGRQVSYTELGIAVTVTPDGKVRNEITGKVASDGERRKLYGGKITENICQEMARHVLVQAIYNLDQAGFPTRVSIHDENVICIPKERATRETCREIERIMSITPSWAPGLPLAAATSIMERYTK